jgi:tetratricopeptide (TPR) repeat protein
MSRTPKTLNFATLLLLLTSGVPAWQLALRAQTPPATPPTTQLEMAQLELGKVKTATIKGDEKQTYQIPLEKGQYLHLIVEQKSVDVIVTLFDPQGQQILEVDGTARSGGLILAIAEKTGNYRLQVRRYEQDAPQGDYGVKLVELKAASQKEREKVSAYLGAEKAYLEGGNLLNEGKAESYQQALGKFQEAFTAYQQVGHRSMAGVALIQIGNTYRNLADYPKALDSYQQALAIARETGEIIGEGWVLEGMGNTYYAQGDKEKAVSFYQQALAIWQKVPERPEGKGTLNNLGLVYYSLAACRREGYKPRIEMLSR